MKETHICDYCQNPIIGELAIVSEYEGFTFHKDCMERFRGEHQSTDPRHHAGEYKLQLPPPQKKPNE